MNKIRSFFGRSSTIILVTAFATSLTACGSSTQQGATSSVETIGTSDQTSTEENTVAESVDANRPLDGAEVVIDVGYSTQGKDITSQGIEKWKSLLEEKSGGTMSMELYLDGTLGDQGDILNNMQMGEADITIADGALLAEYGSPDLGILFGPYLFTDWDQVDKLTEGEWFAKENGKLNDNGIQIVAANWHQGIRNIFTKNPVKQVGDLKGLKIRVPNNQIQIEETNAIGASATPLSMSDVYQSLQTGVIDGCENTLSTLLNMKWCEVAKNVYEDEHVYNLGIFVTSKDFFDGLTEDQQKWLIESGKEAGEWANDLRDKDDESVRQSLTNDYNVTFVKPSEEDHQTLVDLCQDFYSKGSQFGWSDGLYDQVMSEIQ